MITFKLSDIARVHPHAACAFTHGVCKKWTCFLHTNPALEDLTFLPALTGRLVSEVERGSY